MNHKFIFDKEYNMTTIPNEETINIIHPTQKHIYVKNNLFYLKSKCIVIEIKYVQGILKLFLLL